MTHSDELEQNQSSKNEVHQLSGRDYFDLWQYCEEVGGRDKDRMVTIVIPLITAAVVALGFIIKENIIFHSFFCLSVWGQTCNLHFAEFIECIMKV
jgi:hypothetical protein